MVESQPKVLKKQELKEKSTYKEFQVLECYKESLFKSDLGKTAINIIPRYKCESHLTLELSELRASSAKVLKQKQWQYRNNRESSRVL